MILDRRWLIKDGQLSEKTIKYIREQKGEFELIFRRHQKKRTNPQNRAIHLYCDMVATALNENGQDVRRFIKPGFDIMWTGYLVKELLWRPTQKILFGKKSTTQLKKIGEIEKIYDVLNKATSERAGAHIPFPSEETWEEQEK